MREMLPGKALSLISSFLHVSSSARSNSPATTAANEPSSSSIAGAPREGEATAVVFSKDRPGQLLACLLSLLDKIEDLAQVRVILAASNPQSLLRYDAVKERLHSERHRILWFKEDDANGFSPTLQQCLSTLPSTCEFVLFQVDDAIHYRSLNIHDCCALLKSRGDILNVHLKLWSNITVCNSAGNKEMTVPPIVETFQLINRESFGEDSSVSKLMVFERSRGTLDWNYPFDLSGGLYRRDAIDQLLQHLLKTPKTISTPNRFEVEGNKELVAMSAVLQPLSACMDVPVMSIVTINRVQDEFVNPVFHIIEDSTTNQKERIQSSPPWERLTNVIFERGMDLDSYKLASASFNSCHIGQLLLNDLPDPEVSVLIPCRNAETTLRRALESVMEDIHQTTPQISAEIVVVDDASTDASPFIAQQMKHREEQKSEGKAVKIRIVARARSNGSVADCLDEGLRSCRGRFIVRMDADDVNLPGRIQAQLQIMRERPGLGVLGTKTWIITPEGGKREAPTPIGPASLAWSLFFYCPLVHPSVCIRKDLVFFVVSSSKNDTETITGYARTNAASSSWKDSSLAKTDSDDVSLRLDVRSDDKAIEDSRMEDYLLWHRILDQGRAVMDNAPIFGLELHQHHHSITASWRENESQKEKRDLEQARIALRYAQRRSGALQSVTDRLWMIVCRGRITNETDRLHLIQGIHFVQQGLDALRESIEREFKDCLSVGGKDDLAFVLRDCEARKLELAAICGVFHSSGTVVMS